MIRTSFLHVLLALDSNKLLVCERHVSVHMLLHHQFEDHCTLADIQRHCTSASIWLWDDTVFTYLLAGGSTSWRRSSSVREMLSARMA